MSSSPGTRPSFGSILAGLVAVRRPRRARLPARPIRTRRSSGASFRRIRSTTPGPADQRPLHDRLRDRRGDLLPRRGPDRLERDPLPAPARRHGAAAPDPRPQPRRDRLDRHPDDHRHLPVLHLVADAQHRRGDRATARPQGQGRRRPVPVDVRLPAGRRRSRQQAAVHGHGARSARTAASSCRPARRPTSTSRAST